MRFNEHLGINKSGGKLSNPYPSSIGDHIKQNFPTASLEDFHNWLNKLPIIRYEHILD